MGFQFNFDIGESEKCVSNDFAPIGEIDKNESVPEKETPAGAEEAIGRAFIIHADLPARLQARRKSKLPVRNLELVESGNVTMAYLEDKDEECDVESGEYEGGRVLWEGTKDLLAFLDARINFQLGGNRVMDLGCGQGLLGIYALSKGATEVHFTDYNEK